MKKTHKNRSAARDARLEILIIVCYYGCQLCSALRRFHYEDRNITIKCQIGSLEICLLVETFLSGYLHFS